jgi:hypothetical protein
MLCVPSFQLLNQLKSGMNIMHWKACQHCNF